MALADRVQSLLESRGDNMNQAAARTGLGYATIYGIVKGTNQNPSTETLERLAAGYNIPVSRLLDDSLPMVREGEVSGERGVSSRPIQLLATVELPEGVRRQSGVPRIRSLYAHIYAIGVSEGFSDAELAVLEKWRDAEVDRARGENGS